VVVRILSRSGARPFWMAECMAAARKVAPAFALGSKRRGYDEGSEGGSAVKNLSEYSFLLRLETAAISYVRYIGKAFWPAKLVGSILTLTSFILRGKRARQWFC